MAYLLESEFGIELPKDMQREFGPIANDEVDKLGREVSAAELKQMFWREYIERTTPWQLKKFETESKNGVVNCRAKLLRDGKVGWNFPARATARWPRWFMDSEKSACRVLKSPLTASTP